MKLLPWESTNYEKIDIDSNSNIFRSYNKVKRGLQFAMLLDCIFWRRRKNSTYYTSPNFKHSVEYLLKMCRVRVGIKAVSSNLHSLFETLKKSWKKKKTIEWMKSKSDELDKWNMKIIKAEENGKRDEKMERILFIVAYYFIHIALSDRRQDRHFMERTYYY